MPSSETIGGRLRECPDCGLFQRMPALERRSVLRCPRCGAILERSRVDPITRSLALATTGLVLFILATQLDFITLDVRGLTRDTTLISGPVELEQYGMWESRSSCWSRRSSHLSRGSPALPGCCWGCGCSDPPAGLYMVFRWVERLAPWSMVEVFLLGVFVAYTKLVDIAQVEVGGAVYALGGLMLAQVAADAALDRRRRSGTRLEAKRGRAWP